jgi:hypothetical protein
MSQHRTWQATPSGSGCYTRSGPRSNPLLGLILGSVTGAFVTLVLAGFLTLLSVILDITQLVWG